MSLSSLLDDLKKDYLTSLPAKIDRIESYYRQQDIKALTSEFHKLKGTGLTYGFPEISHLAEAVEACCERCPQESEWIVPAALRVLTKIRLRYEAASESPVDQDEDFIKIRTRANNL